MPGLEEVGMAEQMAGNIGAQIAGGVQFFESLSKEKKDKADLAALHQPFYQVQSELYQNRNQAAALAGGGLPAAQLAYMTQESQRGLGAGLDATLRAGGGVNDASILLNQYNQQIGKIGADDAAQHLANIQYFHKLNADIAAEKTKQWSINEYQPYEAKLKELKENIATDEQNKWGGLTTAISSTIGAGTANLNSKLFGNKTSNVSDPYSVYSSPNYTAPQLAQTGDGVPSPAANTPWINPGGPSPAAGVGTISPGSFSSSALIQPIDTSDND